MSKVKKKPARRRTQKTEAAIEQHFETRVTVPRKIKPGKVANAGKVCPVCGCNESDPCLVCGCPCGWVSYQGKLVCTACAPIEALLYSGGGQAWLREALTIAESNAFAIGAGVMRDYEPCAALVKQEGV